MLFVPPLTSHRAAVECATPTSPVLVAEQVTCSGRLMVIAQPVPVVPSESVTLIVNDPAAVGVPVIAPVEVFRVKPTGSVPMIEKV